MADDWQETAFHTRHMHNRIGGGGGGGGGGRRPYKSQSRANASSSSVFDIRRTFGTYSLSCPRTVPSQTSTSTASQGIGGSGVASAVTGSGGEGFLDIYRMTDDGRGVIGSLLLPMTQSSSSPEPAGGSSADARPQDVSRGGKNGQKKDKKKKGRGNAFLEATVVLAGSRKILRQIVDDLARVSRGDDQRAADDDSSAGSDVDEGTGQNGSGKGNGPVVAGQVTREEEENGGNEDEHNQAGEMGDAESKESLEEEEEEEEADEEARYQSPFEKNSFRSPKFWVEWRSTRDTNPTQARHHQTVTESRQLEDDTHENKQNRSQRDRDQTHEPSLHNNKNDNDNPVTPLPSPPTTTAPPISGTGYFIFRANDCRKFSGTISCPQLSWDNIAVSGHKLAACAPRDTVAVWPSSSSSSSSSSAANHCH